MKPKTLTLSMLACAASSLAGVGTALAQERVHAPKQQTPPSNPLPEDNMPVLRSDLTPVPMLTPPMQGGMVNPKTGRYILYNDSRTGLGFDFEKQEIRDYKTGKVYKFSEHPAYKAPKNEPSKKSI